MRPEQGRDHRSDREETIGWAKELTARSDILYLDTETTGLGDDAEIIEIAVLDPAGHGLVDTLVKPRCSIPRQVKTLHGITDEMVADAPPWPAVYRQLSPLLDESSAVVTYNVAFDRRVIEQSCRDWGFQEPEVVWECAMKRYAAYAGEWNDRYETWRWQGLSVAAAALNIEMPISHRAGVDAELCRQFVQRLADEG